MELCDYRSANEKDCIAIFDSNTPFSFAVQERETFQRFLDKLAHPYAYYVVQDDNQKIIACGGTKLESSNHLAWLRWGMVTREFHKRKIGIFLTLSRLYLLSQDPEIQTAGLGTGQHSYQFYEKIGFVLKRITPDGIAPGIRIIILMELKFDKAKRQELEDLSQREFFP